MATLEVKAIVRARNQLTRPGPIVKHFGIEPGDIVIISVDDDEPGVMRLKPMLRGYAGVARGIYGSAEDAEDYVKNERASWNA